MASKKQQDVEWFTCTSDKPYDRHIYRLKFTNGKSVVYDDYELMRNHWFQWTKTGMLSHVVIEDVKKGF